MAQKIIAVVLLLISITFVTVNTIVIDRQIEKMHHDIKELDVRSDGAAEEVARIFQAFQKMEVYISLTVNHDDLTNIEDCFVELVGYLSVGQSEEAKVTKDRLTSSLEHLRRLSTFTIDAII